MDLFGSSPKDIKGYKPISCKNEEGETRNFYVISLNGIDSDKILSMRRCRLSHEVTVEQSEFQLLASEQLTSQQGKDWFAFASNLKGILKRYVQSDRPEDPASNAEVTFRDCRQAGT